MGFKGIVVTDALEMAGLTRLYADRIGRAAVDAFKAGNDLLLIPADLEASYSAVLESVRSGEISPSQLDASVLKILKAKASVGLNKRRLVNLEDLSESVGKPANVALGQRISDDAVTLVRDNGKLLPFKEVGTAPAGLPYQKVEEVHNRLVVVIFVDDVRMDAGRVLERQIRSRVPDVNVVYVDSRIVDGMSAGVLKAADEAQAVIAAVYVVPSAGRTVQANNGLTDSAGLADANAALVQKILDRGTDKTMVLAMGNPYLAQSFPTIQNYICTFSSVSIAEESAVKALFGEIAIHGHLPVTIPGIAERGTGIERPLKVTEGGSQHAHAQSSRH